MASIVYQIKEVLEKINLIGNSKRDFREMIKNIENDTVPMKTDKNEVQAMNFNNSPIFSIKYFTDILDSSIKFGQYIKKEYGIKSIYDIKSEHYINYLHVLDQKGLSKGHLINIESHLIKFQSAIVGCSKQKGKDFVAFVNKRIYSASDREEPKDRSYTIEEINKLITTFSPRMREAMQMGLQLGLRIKEICNIQVKHFVESANGMRLSIPKKDKKAGEKGGIGITKGGRYRDTPVPKEYEIELRNILKGKEPNEKVFGNMKDSTMRVALSRACKKGELGSNGWHGFRHTYSRRRIEELLGSKKDDGIAVIRKMLDNRKKHIFAEKGITDQKLLEFVKEKINQVHSELGHGGNRWGLMKVYVSF